MLDWTLRLNENPRELATLERRGFESLHLAELAWHSQMRLNFMDDLQLSVDDKLWGHYSTCLSRIC